MATDTEIAWFAGLFEGEGYVSLLPGQGIRIGISMTDEDVLIKVHSVFGGRFDNSTKHEPYRTLHRWLITNWAEAIPLLKIILPFMGKRRTSKIKEAIVAYESNEGRRKGYYTPCNLKLGISSAGYVWHQRKSLLPACDSCMNSYQLYMKQYRSKRKKPFT